MSPEPITAERIYHQLKLDIMSGRFHPGVSVISQVVAAEYGTSVSPVRDAMHRLLGERLLRHHEGGGFEIPHVTADELRSLYQWHDEIIRLAIRHRDASAAMDTAIEQRLEKLDGENGLAIVQATTEVFQTIARGSSNSEHAFAIAEIGGRLFTIRLSEHGLRDRKSELIAVWNGYVCGQESAIRDAIRAYHRRRMRRVPMIIDALYAP